MRRWRVSEFKFGTTTIEATHTIQHNSNTKTPAKLADPFIPPEVPTP